jgi:glycyl-tRNA synthetase beta chain
VAEVRDLLVEIGTEELPPRALKTLSESLQTALVRGLDTAQLPHDGARAYATPRRLALWVQGLAAAQPDRLRERRGPALAAAFDRGGAPTQAAVGFARSCGVDLQALERVETDKGAWLMFRAWDPGRPTADLIPDLLRQALSQLPIPRPMRWGDLDEPFVRPVHWLVVLFGDQVIPVRMFGVTAQRVTYGHRFHHPGPLRITDCAAYASLLEGEGRVLADFSVRREMIRAEVEEAAASLGGRAGIDESLLDQVTGLVEWPMALAGAFEERYLALPPEVVIASLKDHQKCFHVVGDDRALLPCFVAVANIESRRPELVRAGNERVIRPRLGDAAFFWDRDRTQTLGSRYGALQHVVFEERLGTMGDRVRRIGALAGEIAPRIGADRALAERAAFLCKCDLMTHMVGEFPELQGVMGRYYALHDGEAEQVAGAIEEHYRPRFAGDHLPQTPTGQTLAIADRLDTLVGIFSLGQGPSGDKDPFGLRRAALAVLRILIEGRLPLDLRELLDAAAREYGDPGNSMATVGDVFDFMMERLRAYYLDQGIRPDEIETVLGVSEIRQPYDFDRRLRAVALFRRLPEAEALSAANKRIRNILRQAEREGDATAGDVNPDLLIADQEKELYRQLRAIEEEVHSSFEASPYGYTEVLTLLARLRTPVDRFFDAVMVRSEDPGLRGNRLALLRLITGLFGRVADISRLQG